MIKINVHKEELENFFDSLKSDFDKLKGGDIKKLGFKKFKEYFCDDNLFLNSEGGINDYLCKTSKCKKINELKNIYKEISSNNSTFYKKIRNFIIKNFTEEIKFCPYCGKVPLIYFDNGKDKKNSYRRLFQFDHFFPKNSYHKGIINFYNLIPSCNACNHLKSDDNPFDVIKTGGKTFHPYFGRLTKDLLKNNHQRSNFDNSTIIKLSFHSTNSKFFKLGQKYLNSQDTFNTFNFIQDKITKIKDEKMRFKKTTKTSEEFIDYFFKNYYPETENKILQYSNGKLKKDLIESIKL